MDSPPALPVRVGEVFAGKYRVDGVLGAGAMGVVVAATHLHLNQPVAVKFLMPDAQEHVGAQARFMREAQTAVRIRSEHVARVIDLGLLEGGLPYMAMELLSGSDLANVIETRGPLPIVEALDYLLQACEAIAEAHSLGMVHRDLKPANIFLTKRADGSPLIKVLDFGISKAAAWTEEGVAAASLTSTGALMGSPAYMSPEQIRDSKTVDARSDIWAVGMILYELLVGRVAFGANTIPGLLACIVADPPQTVRPSRPDVPASLEAVILMCLAKDPAKRPQTIAELAKLLHPFASPASQTSVERVANLQGSRSSPTIVGDTLVDRPPPSPRLLTGSKSAQLPASAAMSPTPAWGATRPHVPVQPLPRAKGAPTIAIVGVVLTLALATAGIATWAVAVRRPKAIATSTPRTDPPPLSSSIPVPSVASEAPMAAIASQPATTAPVPNAATEAGAPAAAAAPPSKGVPATKQTPRTRSTTPHVRDGDLGGAIDSRK